MPEVPESYVRFRARRTALDAAEGAVGRTLSRADLDHLEQLAMAATQGARAADLPGPGYSPSIVFRASSEVTLQGATEADAGLWLP